MTNVLRCNLSRLLHSAKRLSVQRYYASGGDGTTTSHDNPSGSDNRVPRRQGAPSIPKHIIISQSHDIIRNLALEDWYYRSMEGGTAEHRLLLWTNDPCVVIGRHQNPFVETNVSRLEQLGIPLARRNSGGGTVYHDRGNLNLTFFTPRAHYDRKYNLNIILRALYRQWQIKLDINERDDLVVSGYDLKVSGSAAKLGRTCAYHHCTLLFNANLGRLSENLLKEKANYITNATNSTRAMGVCNLQSLRGSNLRPDCPEINADTLMTAIGDEYMRTEALTLADRGEEFLKHWHTGYQKVQPTDYWYSDIEKLRDEYGSWAHVIGKTPKFSVEKEVELGSAYECSKATLKIDVEAGLVRQLQLLLRNANQPLPIVTKLLDQPYSERYLKYITTLLKQMPHENVQMAISSKLFH